MAEENKKQSIEDVVGNHIKKLMLQDQVRNDMDDYYTTFGIPENERAKFVFDQYGTDPYVGYEKWNDYKTAVPVAYWRDDMLENFGGGKASSAANTAKRTAILEDAVKNETQLADNANYSWNNYNLLKRAIETKFPSLEVTFNSGYRFGLGQKEHGTGQAFDIQIGNYGGNKRSHTLNLGVVYPTMQKVLGNTINQYIDETEGNGYWSHISTVQPMQEPKFKIDPAVKEMFEFNPNIKDDNGRIKRKSRFGVTWPSQLEIDNAIQFAGRNKNMLADEEE